MITLLSFSLNLKKSLAHILQQVDDVISRMENNLVVIVWNKPNTYDVGVRKEPTCKYMNSVSKGKYLERQGEKDKSFKATQAISINQEG
jgi:hypothetical protein